MGGRSPLADRGVLEALFRPANPQSDFCAVMVCSDAADNCPVVVGASQRVALSFDDPKEYDGTPQEAVMYAQRRDQIGRAMLLALCPTS